MVGVLGLLGVGLVIAWVMAHLPFVAASLVVLTLGLVAGRARPAGLRLLAGARIGAALIGCRLVRVGLLQRRDTEPRRAVHWVVLGLAVLAGAGAGHRWVVRP